MAIERKRALVTGGASGIGLGVTQALVGAGYQVMMIGRSVERLREATNRLGEGVSWMRADVSIRTEVEAALDGVERLNVLVNAAGFARGVSLELEADEADTNWDAVIGTNLKGAYLMTHAAAHVMASPGGRIINIGSIAAQTGGSRPGSLAYAAAKSGLHGLTFALAREVAPRGITANVVAPGFIAETGFTGAWPSERVTSIVAETPIGRAGQASDIAAAVLWLASESGGFVTGAVIPVNGGWRIG